jgi:hypothetical protein
MPLYDEGPKRIEQTKASYSQREQRQWVMQGLKEKAYVLLVQIQIHIGQIMVHVCECLELDYVHFLSGVLTSMVKVSDISLTIRNPSRCRQTDR